MCRLSRNSGILNLLEHTGPVIGLRMHWSAWYYCNLTYCLWTGGSLDEALRDRGGPEFGSRHHIQHACQHRYWPDTRHHQPSGATSQHHWAKGQWWWRKYHLVLLTSLIIIYSFRRVFKTPRKATASFHCSCPSFRISVRMEHLDPTGRIFVIFDNRCSLLQFFGIFRKS
jgi:hypothetical protein